jgi:tetratricopeptide (TPR) repeat protein
VEIRWLWPIFFAVVLSGQSSDPACALERAVQLHQAGDYDGAIREYRNCLASQPGRVEVRSNLGAVLAKLGRYQEAIGEYQEALRSAGSAVAPRLRFNLALAYYKSFAIPEAAALFEELRQNQSADLNLALLLADCRLRMGQFRQAVEVLTPLEAAAPDEPALDYILGMALIRDGRVAEGQRRVDRILRRGDSAEGHFLLGSAGFTAGNYPAAVEEFLKAAALSSDLPSLQSYLGQALLFTGDADGAMAAFRKALAVDPNDFDANFHLAQILARRGEGGESHKLLERAALVRPGSLEAKAALAEGFHFEQAAAGGVAVGAVAPPIGPLDPLRIERPAVLVFGSYTCPKLRSSAAELKRIAAAYHGRVDFRLVYISEAHAQGGPESQWQSTVNIKEGIDLPPARNLAEKEAHASLCVRKLSLPFAAVVDGMDAAAERAYDAWPSRLYLVGQDGRVQFQTRLGELDFRPAELERAIREILAKRGPDGRSR